MYPELKKRIYTIRLNDRPIAQYERVMRLNGGDKN